MAGGIDWFRWHHGTVTDQKFPLVARRAGATVAEVIAVWACLLEHGSQSGASVKEFDWGHADGHLGLRAGLAADIGLMLAARGLLADDRIASPRKHFPARSMRPSGGRWRVIRAAVFQRDSYTCRYCGSRGGRLECDHVVPVADGGAHDEANLRTACFGCNRKKAAKSVEEFMRDR
jgi:HNH endonuclease